MRLSLIVAFFYFFKFLLLYFINLITAFQDFALQLKITFQAYAF